MSHDSSDHVVPRRLKIGLAYTSKTEMAEEIRRRGQEITDDALEEYDSHDTVEAIAAGIRTHGHDVELLGWGHGLLDKVGRKRPDLVFNIAEGLGGRAREAQVPATLEMLGIPYIGSDALALAVSLDKAAAKELVKAVGVAVPRGFLVHRPEGAVKDRWRRCMDYPLIVKPSHEGSSRGIFTNSVVWEDRELEERSRQIVDVYKQPALVEEYIWGREVTVGVTGDPAEIFGIMEVLSAARKEKDVAAWTVYSLEAKRNWQMAVNYACPAEFNKATDQRIREAALLAFEALGCRDVARVDFRINTGETPVFLEINPLPGLNPESSDLILMARALGISYEDVIGKIIRGAVRRLSEK